MRRRLICLLPLWVACGAEPIGDGDPLRPQPIPEYFAAELNADHIAVSREGDRLQVQGAADAAQAGATHLLLTAIEGGPLLEIPLAADRSFSAELDAPTGDVTDLLLLAFNEQTHSAPLRLRHTAAATTVLPPPCLTGSVGLINLGQLSSQEGSQPDLRDRFRLNNACGRPLDLSAVTLRGLEPGFTVNAGALPRTLAGSETALVELSYSLPFGQEPRTRYEFLRIQTEAADDSGGGVIVRVRGPAR